MKHIQRIYAHNALPVNQYLVEHRDVNASGDLIGYISHVEIDSGVITHIRILAMWGIAGPGQFDHDLDLTWGEPTSEVLNVGFIGDIVVISTTDETTYHIYREGEYKLNKSLKELPEIQLGITDYDGTLFEYLGNTTYQKPSWEEALSEYLRVVRENQDNENKYDYGHIFLIAAYKLIDNTVIKQSLPFYHPVGIDGELLQSGIIMLEDPDDASEKVYTPTHLMGTRLKYKIEHEITPDWLDVIKSIDIYALYIPYFSVPETLSFGSMIGEVKQFAEKDLDTEFKGGIFHKIDSITLVKPETGNLVIDEEKDIILKNYQTKENLIPDQLSMHELCFNKSMTYNGRLHIANTLQYLFEGYNWSLPFMTWQDENNPRILQDLCDLVAGPSILPYTLEAADFDFITSGTRGQPILKVTIQTDDGERIVYRELDAETQVVSGNSRKYILLPKVFTYPHPNAKNFEICYVNDDKELSTVYSGNFTSHDFYSFGYHVFESPVVFYDPLIYMVFDGSPLDEWKAVSQPNRLQLSAVENPFYWPLINSYRIGEDKYNRINDLAVQSTPTSEGQFGQYPLIVFARNGIFLVNQGQEVVYANVINISNLEANEGVMGIDGAVIFSTRHDLYVLQGRTPELLSRFLISNTVYTTENTTTSENPITDPVSGLTFIQGLTFGYDSQHKEIVIANPDYLHHYRFSPSLKYFTSVTQGYHGFVVKHGNYQGYVISGTDKDTLTIYDISDDDTSGDIRVYFKTNPQNLDFMEFKKFMRLGYYCQGTTGDYLNFFVFGENLPEETFPILQYSKLGAAKDFLYLIAGRSPYSVRYFIYMLSGDVDPDSVFHHIETEVVPVLPGRMR